MYGKGIFFNTVLYVINSTFCFPVDLFIMKANILLSSESISRHIYRSVYYVLYCLGLIEKNYTPSD